MFEVGCRRNRSSGTLGRLADFLCVIDHGAHVHVKINFNFPSATSTSWHQLEMTFAEFREALPERTLYAREHAAAGSDDRVWRKLSHQTQKDKEATHAFCLLRTWQVCTFTMKTGMAKLTSRHQPQGSAESLLQSSPKCTGISLRGEGRESPQIRIAPSASARSALKNSSTFHAAEPSCMKFAKIAQRAG